MQYGLNCFTYPKDTQWIWLNSWSRGVQSSALPRVWFLIHTVFIFVACEGDASSSSVVTLYFHHLDCGQIVIPAKCEMGHSRCTVACLTLSAGAPAKDQSCINSDLNTSGGFWRHWHSLRSTTLNEVMTASQLELYSLYDFWPGPIAHYIGNRLPYWDAPII